MANKDGDKVELKPCPFCGGISSLIEDGTKTVSMINHDIAYEYYVECNDCSARTKCSRSEDKAIKAWNTRVGEVSGG